MPGGCGAGVVFVCATAQYPVGGLTAPSSLLLFRRFLRPGLLIMLLAAVLPRRSRVSFNAAFSLSLAVPDGDAVFLICHR